MDIRRWWAAAAVGLLIGGLATALPFLASVNVEAVRAVRGPTALMAAATDDTARVTAALNHRSIPAVWVEWTGAAAGGNLEVQVARTDTYAGTWVVVTTLPPLTNAAQWVALPAGVGAVRTHLTGALGVGSVSAYVYSY